MSTYHLNRATGQAGRCSAAPGNCPFGSELEHYSTPSEARRVFEEQQLTIPAPAKAPLRLESIVDIELMNRMLREKVIYRSYHPHSNEYLLLCYSKVAQIFGRWNEATTLARGLIVNVGKEDLSDAEVLERPWGKFFTLGQHEGGWHLGDEENNDSESEKIQTIDFNAPARVYDKVDGSLGILYRAPDGAPAFATKGSFSSEQALSYTKRLREQEKTLSVAQELLSTRTDVTSLFELIGPKNRVVLSYDSEQIVLLGGARKRDGADVAPESFEPWQREQLPTVERMEASSLSEALALPPRQNREGVVVTIEGEHPMKIKVKQDDYIRLHRIVTMFSKKESRALVFDLGESTTMADLLAVAESKDVSYFEPIRQVLNIDGFTAGNDTYEFVRSRRESYFQEILLPRVQKIQEAKKIIDELPAELFEGANPRKKFAEMVKTLPAETALLHVFFKARLEGKQPKELGALREIRKAVRDVKDRED